MRASSFEFLGGLRFRLTFNPKLETLNPRLIGLIVGFRASGTGLSEV